MSDEKLIKLLGELIELTQPENFDEIVRGLNGWSAQDCVRLLAAAKLETDDLREIAVELTGLCDAWEELQ